MVYFSDRSNVLCFKMKKIFIFISILSSISVYAKSKPELFENVQLIDCHDGDTCKFKLKGREIKVRLSGVDAPEIKQDYGSESRKCVLDLLQSAKAISLSCLGKSYHRRVCEILVDSKDAGSLLVEQGCAWDEPKYSKGRYKSHELKAKEKKVGIWKTSPIRPNCFRHPKKC
jgi:micrococcal nuclease